MAPKERVLRDALERSQHELRLLKKQLETLTQENELLKAQLQQARGEQERLTRLLLKDLKPAGQKSAFSVHDVAELVGT